MDKLEALFTEVFFDDRLVKAVFSAKRRKSLPFSKVVLRPVSLGGELCYQAEYFFPQKVTHENVNRDSICGFCLDLMRESFKQANVFTAERDIQVLAARPEAPRIDEKKATLQVGSVAHNRKKKYAIPGGTPCDFLIKLGVMDGDGKVFQKHYAKFRQINRYLEIVDSVLPYLIGAASCGRGANAGSAAPDAESAPEKRPLRIIDFGCGKAYLTFALYYYLKKVRGIEVEIVGLDLKSDVIDFCGRTARELGYTELRFQCGDIADYESDGADMVVTLHACDTATDYALINAVNWGASVILSVLCCQHELFSQIDQEIHRPMLKHGILKDRLTEYLTDGLRGLKLESKGYDVAMIEFTSLEHTQRNIMIKAVKRFDPESDRARRAQKEYEALRDFYHVKPTIDKMI